MSDFTPGNSGTGGGTTVDFDFDMDNLSAAGGIFGAISSWWNARKNREFQEDVFDYKKDLQTTIFDREDSSYQRKVADMEAAGLNPAWAAGGAGAGAGSPINVTAPQQSQGAGEAASQGLQTYLAMMQAKEQIQNTKAQRDILDAQKDLVNAQTAKTQADTASTNVNTDFARDTFESRVRTQLAIEGIREREQTIKSNEVEIANARANAQIAQSDADKLEATVRYIEADMRRAWLQGRESVTVSLPSMPHREYSIDLSSFRNADQIKLVLQNAELKTLSAQLGILNTQADIAARNERWQPVEKGVSTVTQVINALTNLIKTLSQ